MFYPYNTELQEAAQSYGKGNFGLWFNKLIPLNNANACKPCDKNENDKEAIPFYKSEYDSLIRNNSVLPKLLEKKHDAQNDFCQNFEKISYETIVIRAELKSPLITGIGQAHPNEVGMVFDHTLGIPYIPAASIKGIVRFAHTLGLIDSKDADTFINGEELDETIGKTRIPDLFGGNLKKNGKKEKIEMHKGKVIFLDAYPAKTPQLHIDIMNPHYGAYYSDEQGLTPPADYLEPKPIKFLTVKPGTTFIFRALTPANKDLKKYLFEAYKSALHDEGVGAKTAVGYGRFEILAENKSEQMLTQTAADNQKKGVTKKDADTSVIWQNARLKWMPGNRKLTASIKKSGKNYTADNTFKSKDKITKFVPKEYRSKLFAKKKKAFPVKAVKVQCHGNSFRIVEVLSDL